ncbi:MAG TPA: sulfatase [Solirubrobacteraceae bacterium]
MAFSRPRVVRLPASVGRCSTLVVLVATIGLLGGCGSSPHTATLARAPGVSGATSPTTPSVVTPATGNGGTPSTEASALPPGHPNIVFVLTDDLAWNLVRYMPHVVRMEREGVTFGNYFVTDSLCCPSRASILSGRLPHNTRVFDNSPPEGGYSVFHERGEERATFATALQRVGYRTALMGKYLNGYQPAAGGGGRTSVPPGWSEWDVAGNGYPEYGYHLNSNGHLHRYGYRAKDYLTNVLAQKSVRFIDRSAASRRPFMLEVATFAPHSPFTPAPRDVNAFPGLRVPRTPAFGVTGVAEPSWLSHFTPLDAMQVGTLDRQFRKRAQAVQGVDRLIGRIEAELAAKGLARSTYIVFSSDNGLHMGEHRLLTGKLTAFDTDIRVPLIVTGPGVPAGRAIEQMAENIDLCPSFEQLAGARTSPEVDGRSLVALWHGRHVAGWRGAVLVEHHGRVTDTGDPDLPTRGSGNPPSYEAMRTPRGLYVEYGNGEREYYDLRSDPFELRNIAAELPLAQAERLHRMLLGMEECHGGSACWRAQHGSV